ncbi:MAG TPA: peptide deformylase [Clostridiaceae bacterium]|nr:peptide deformylase [Clostridiaceae bacterium]
MAIRKILHEGDPTLLKKSRRVKRFDDRLATLADDMIETMYDSDGVGLAAPQVGVLRRLFVMDVMDSEGEEEPVIFVNPEIIAEDGVQRGIEGCLSLPGLVGVVSRPLTVTIRAQDIDGEYFEETYTGLAARCVCHETDHLDGILYRRRSETVLCTREEYEEEVRRKAEIEAARQEEGDASDDDTVSELSADEECHDAMPEDEVDA